MIDFKQITCLLFWVFQSKGIINTEEALAVKKITLLAIMVFVIKRY